MKKEEKSKGGKSEQAPGQQMEISVPNVNDPNAAPWTGTKAEYKAKRAELEAQGYVKQDEATTEQPVPAQGVPEQPVAQPTPQPGGGQVGEDFELPEDKQ
jgi:hypothetical protein